MLIFEFWIFICEKKQHFSIFWNQIFVQFLKFVEDFINNFSFYLKKTKNILQFTIKYQNIFLYMFLFLFYLLLFYFNFFLFSNCNCNWNSMPSSCLLTKFETKTFSKTITKNKNCICNISNSFNGCLLNQSNI